MYIFKNEAALVLVLLVGGISWVKCSDDDFPPFDDTDLGKIDSTCGDSPYTTACCPNLKVALSEASSVTVELSEDYRGGTATCKCRCGVADNIKKVDFEVERAAVSHYFCKAGFGPTLKTSAGNGSNGGEGGADASVSGASILQLCKVMVFAVLMAATTILIICYE